MFNTLVDIFSRAQQNKALTPNERAIVKAVKGAIIGVIINLLPQINNMVANHQTFSITQSGIAALVGAFTLALIKLWSAQDDPVLGPIHALAQQKEKEALDSLSVAPTDGTIPVWQFTVPSIQATAIKTTVPAKPVLQPAPARQFATVSTPTVTIHDAPTIVTPAISMPPLAPNTNNPS